MQMQANAQLCVSLRLLTAVPAGARSRSAAGLRRPYATLATTAYDDLLTIYAYASFDRAGPVAGASLKCADLAQLEDLTAAKIWVLLPLWHRLAADRILDQSVSKRWLKPLVGTTSIYTSSPPIPTSPKQSVIRFPFTSLETALRRGGIFRRLQRRGPVE
jgi:hypothetical protein